VREYQSLSIPSNHVVSVHAKTSSASNNPLSRFCKATLIDGKNKHAETATTTTTTTTTTVPPANADAKRGKVMEERRGVVGYEIFMFLGF